jgi:hypothetical protein
VTAKCAYCRSLDTTHSPDCADKPLEKSELKRLFAYRDRSTSAQTWSPWVPIGQDLLTVLESRHVALEIKELLSELATIVTMADANHSTPTDAGRRGSAGRGLPSFDPAAAERELEAAGKRIRQEVEKLAGVTRNPHRSPEPVCDDCQKRPRLVDTLCGPCAARILKEHRRTG